MALFTRSEVNHLFATGATSLTGWNITGGNFTLAPNGNVTIDTPSSVTQIAIVATTYNGQLYPSICQNLDSFIVDTVAIFNTLPVLTGLTHLTSISIVGTALTTCPLLIGLTALQSVSFYPTTTTPPTLSGLPSLLAVSFTGAAISNATRIDNVIIQVNQSASLLSTMGGSLAVDGGTNAPPTGASTTALLNLQNILGWTVVTN